MGRLRSEERRWIGRVALQLLGVELDAEAGHDGDLERAVSVELERHLGDTVDIGAVANELDEVDIGKCRRELAHKRQTAWASLCERSLELPSPLFTP